MNLRSRSKARAVAPRAALKMKPTIPASSTASDHLDLDEAALRKLPRSELQKLAMGHKVKANLKSELIIRQLLRLQIPKKTRPAEDDPKEGPSRKKHKRENVQEKVSPEDQVAPGPDVHLSRDPPSVEDTQLPKAGPSAARPASPAQEGPIALSYDKGLFSGTESEMTEEEQLDYATPVSSRAETPPAANVNDLKRCVTIMQAISAQDVALLKEVTSVRETAVKLRRKARDLRDLVKAERGRRERMETYFRYWQETEPSWDREWLYGEKEPDRRDSETTGSQQQAVPTPGRGPTLSPDELKKKRDAIISKQQAEQRQLESLRRRETRCENSSSRGASEATDDGSGVDLPSTVRAA